MTSVPGGLRVFMDTNVSMNLVGVFGKIVEDYENNKKP
jgi:hypothetical protein